MWLGSRAMKPSFVHYMLLISRCLVTSSHAVVFAGNSTLTYSWNPVPVAMQVLKDDPHWTEKGEQSSKRALDNCGGASGEPVGDDI